MTTSSTPAGRIVDPSLLIEGDDPPSLAGSQCRVCSTVTFPAQTSCPRCTSQDVERQPLPRSGTLWAFTVQEFAPKTPYLNTGDGFQRYAVGYVDLGAVIVETRIVTEDPATLVLGSAMDLVLDAFHHDDDGAVITFAFTPSSNADPASTIEIKEH